jgi:hypothetical protein
MQVALPVTELCPRKDKNSCYSSKECQPGNFHGVIQDEGYEPAPGGVGVRQQTHPEELEVLQEMVSGCT